MGAHHGHDHGRLDADRRALSIALALIAGLTVGEFVAGFAADSLARSSVVQLSTVERRAAE
jgi:Co/Zn/Cd efflux system component